MKLRQFDLSHVGIIYYSHSRNERIFQWNVNLTSKKNYISFLFRQLTVASKLTEVSAKWEKINQNQQSNQLIGMINWQTLKDELACYDNINNSLIKFCSIRLNLLNRNDLSHAGCCSLLSFGKQKVIGALVEKVRKYWRLIETVDSNTD